MNSVKRVVNVLLAVLLCFLFVVSVIDTEEVRQKTNFDQSNILAHIGKLSENGPRSIADKEENQKAIDYIVSQVESYGVQKADTTDAPAYLIQDFVAVDKEGRYQNWYLQNVIVHIPANADEPSGEALMFMAHFDSVPMRQGASDDSVACSVMLEAIRYYLNEMANGYELTNDLVFAFVNGEEYGLYGSKAFLGEFTAFDDVLNRIKFVTNLESRGTSGTLIMFETAKNNYHTIKLFSEVNKNLFTCSIATMVYDMMPNSTDFTTFKDAYQGLNMANITGGENYHTQNDSPANVGKSYFSQQAQIVDGLIAKLGNYDLDLLYEAKESAIFFSYLNVTTVVYDHTTSTVLAILGLVLLISNILLSIFYRRAHNAKKTAKGLLTVVAGLILSAVAAYVCYYLFQGIAILFGVIDVHMIGTITYSNPAIVIGIGILSLAMTALNSYFACRWLNIERRDILRAFAYTHVFLGSFISFVLPDAGYLFIFSGILLMLNELMITLVRKSDMSGYHLELIATALYFPIVIPIIVLATSALGLTMAYVYGLVFALSVFAVGVDLLPLLKYLSLRALYQACRKKKLTTQPMEGVAHVMAVALIIFLVVSVSAPNAAVNLQGKQNIIKLPYDDALVYVLDESGEYEYRIYDLNAYRALKAYSPKMTYASDHYVGKGKEKEIGLSILSSAEASVLTVKKTADDSLIYLDFVSHGAASFIIEDGITSQTYIFPEDGAYSIKLHSDCTVTLNGGTATIAYKEVVRDYEPLIPEEYENDDEPLHFNLWLTAEFTLAAE